MKKFIFEISFVALGLLVLAYTIYQRDNSYLVNQIRALDENHPLELIHLGASHTTNFEYDNINLKARRFNKQANTVYYDLQNYRYLQEYLLDSAIVCIPVSYLSFGTDQNRTDRGGSFVNDFYHYLPGYMIHDYSWKKRVKVMVFQTQKNFEKDLGMVPEVNKKMSLPNRNISRKKREAEKLAELREYTKGKVKMHRRLFKTKNIRANLKYLEELIQESISNGHRPILISVPMHYTLNEEFDSLWLEENYFSLMFSLSENFQTPFLDYSHDDRIVNESNYFFDSDHLNGRGRKVFNEIFWKDLVDVNYLKPEQVIL